MTDQVLSQVLSQVRISEVYRALTGIEPRRTGRDTWRGPAPWRGGDSPESVSGDDTRGVWHDFVTDEGGGLLDLVVQIRGGNRADALRFVADMAGIPLEPMAAADLERWKAERLELERLIRDARYWRRAAVDMAEGILHRLKTALFDPTLPRPDVSEIRSMTDMLARLQGAGDTMLLSEYRWWCEHYPNMTAAMVRTAKRLEAAERRALLAYLRMTDRRRHAA